MLAQARGEGYVFNVGVEPEHFLVVKNPDGSIAPWDPAGAEGLEKPCYDFKGLSGAMGYLQEMMEGLNGLGWEVYSRTTRTPTVSTRSTSSTPTP